MTGYALDDLQTADEMEAMLRRIGAERYHIHHPFHKLLHGGKLRKGQVQAWALNRYYYQSRIPMKDAALLSRVADRELRREWLVRILDHDGYGEQEGGIVRIVDRVGAPGNVLIRAHENQSAFVTLAPAGL